MSAYKDLHISFPVCSDLLLANHLAAACAQILFHNVLSFRKNIIPAFDLTEFAQLLEDEAQGVVDSDKLLSIDQLRRLRSALLVFYKSVENEPIDVVKEYSERRIGWTQEILETMIKVLETHSALPRQEMKINRLLDFKWVVLNEIKSNTCSNLKNVRVLLTFKVADDNGDYQVQNLDVSIEEALALKNELSHVVDMLN